MKTIGVLFVSTIAVSGGAAAETTRRITNFPIRQNDFSDFCQAYSLDQKGSQLQVSGECSPEPNVPSRIGGALSSCQCDVGFTLCPTCNGTSLQCAWKNAGGTGKKTTLMDMNKFLGIGLDSEGRVVLYCNGVWGEWNQCTKNGAKTDCPSTPR